MSTSQQVPRPSLGEEGAPCANCGTPLAADQRYCLNCGARRGELRLPYERYLAGNGRAEAKPAPAPAARQSDVSPLGAVLGIALLGGMLLIGVLLGRGEDQTVQAPTPAAATPTEATATGDGGSATGADEPESSLPPATVDEVVSDWPVGREGFTLELTVLAKDATTPAEVEAARADLETGGANDVGVLDSDLYPSLPGGNYVIYSGVYESKGDAKAALEGLRGEFPAAGVIEVSAQEDSSGADNDLSTPEAEADPPGDATRNGGGVETG